MWIAVDKSEGNWEIFNTEEKARKQCEQWIDDIRGNGEGWLMEEDMEGFMYGRLTHKAKQINRQTREEWEKENPEKEAWFDENYSYVCDYEMQKL